MGRGCKFSHLNSHKTNLQITQQFFYYSLQAKYGVRIILFLGNNKHTVLPSTQHRKHLESLTKTKYKPKTVEAKLYT